MSWNTAEFRQLVEQRYGAERRDVLSQQISSIAWKLTFAHYHADESLRVIRDVLPDRYENETTEVAKQIVRSLAQTGETDDFWRATWRSEAHLIAFAQSLHSLADILAGIIYDTVDDNDRAELKPRRRYLGDTVAALKSHGRVLAIRDAGNGFIRSTAFRYLTAYVNTTKHRSLVPSRFQAGLSEGKHGVRIAAFECGDDHWDEKWGGDFIKEDFAAIRDGVSTIGTALSDYLR